MVVGIAVVVEAVVTVLTVVAVVVLVAIVVVSDVKASVLSMVLVCASSGGSVPVPYELMPIISSSKVEKSDVPGVPHPKSGNRRSVANPKLNHLYFPAFFKVKHLLR